MISNAFLELIESLLGCRFQRTVLNDKTSEWLPVKTVLPQGSILGFLSLLICINNLSSDIVSTPKLYAGDWSLFFCFSRS